MTPKRCAPERVDVAMVGTFSAWRLGTLQARALPLAVELRHQGIHCAIVTVPWDQPTERGVTDSIAGVPLINTRRVSVRGAIGAVWEQAALIRSLNPRLVHVFKPKGFGAAAAAGSRHLPVLVDSDDWEGDGGWNRLGSYSRLQRRVFDRQERFLIRAADGVTAASTLLAHRARALRTGRSAHAVTHLPNGLPRAWFEQLHDAGSGRRPPQCDEVTRIVLYSRFAEFPAGWLSAYLSSLSESADREFEISVIGEQQIDADERIDHPDGGSFINVNLMGYVAKDRLPELLSSATIALYPYSDSLVSRSKHSVKLLELMASGCAIIASDMGDIPAVLDGAGTLVSGTDARQFARSTIELASRVDLRLSMTAVGQARVSRLFTTDQLAKNLSRVYCMYWADGA